MNYDNWLQEPYTSAALRDAQWERNAERIYKSYNRKELFPEFLSVFGEEIEQDNPICNAVAQRDFEAIGGVTQRTSFTPRWV